MLDSEGPDLIVSDNGPGVAVRDADAIFEFGFTRRPGGRGMGLYISRETLREAGFDLTLDRSRSDRGSCFRISPKELDVRKKRRRRSSRT